MTRAYIPSDTAWAAEKVAPFPAPWQSSLVRTWRDKSNIKRVQDRRNAGRHTYVEAVSTYEGNIWLRDIADKFNSHALPLDAGDADIRQKAEELALRCWSLAEAFPVVGELRRAMGRVCESAGIVPPIDKIEDRPAIARMTDALWWRRGLRKVHAKLVEGAAIELGYVHRAREVYASDETVLRRNQQNRRNAATLEHTLMENDEGQQFTLAELASKSTANKAIRRAELMTRIAGFERIARDCGHDGLFLTITCPSRMHKWRTVQGGRVVQNVRYDGTLPRDAQRYLAQVWARIRARLKRQGIGIYGFRIAEPNHDGTPHWHMILFVEPLRFWGLCEIVQGHALQDSPDEPGAFRHRVEYVRIDFESGSAAGYIAKYVAKNIDGMYVERDLLGNDAMHTSARVEAWATTWGIRQFQQIGGAPVTVWRELRRVKEVPEDYPEVLRVAHEAVNRIESEETEEVKAAAWDAYTAAQGGVFIGRDYKIRVAKAEQEGQGRYGEALGARPVGVEVVTPREYFIGRLKAVGGLVAWFVESVRHVWRGVKNGLAGKISAGNAVSSVALRGRVGGADMGKGAGVGLGALARPWTGVNNCTPKNSRAADSPHDWGAVPAW